jgi:hypothetical protein
MNVCPQCEERGIFGYRNPDGLMTWYWINYRRGRFCADARRDGSSEHPGPRPGDNS